MEKLRPLMENKRGQISSLYNTILMLILIGILLGIGLLVSVKILDKINTSGGLPKSSDAYLSFNETITETGGVADWIGIIVIVVVASIVLGLIIGSFAQRRMGA